MSEGDLCTPLPRLSITYFRFAEMISVSQGKVIIQFCMSGRRLMRLFSHPVNHFLATRRNLFRLCVVSRSVPLRERRTCLKAGVGVNQILLFLSICCDRLGAHFRLSATGAAFSGRRENSAGSPLGRVFKKSTQTLFLCSLPASSCRWSSRSSSRCPGRSSSSCSAADHPAVHAAGQAAAQPAANPQIMP